MQPNDIALQKAIADLDARWRQRFQEAANDLKMRQWCLEQAIAFGVGITKSLPAGAVNTVNFDLVQTAASMCRFLVEPYAASPPAD